MIVGEGVRMKKLVYVIATVAFLVLLSSSFANAYLDADVTVGSIQINKNAPQTITATTNAGGFGILFVIQPALGTPWMNYLNSHPALKWLWLSLPFTTRMTISNAIGGKIVSYKLVTIGNGGGSQSFSFPTDFIGINGEPSTGLLGKYKVFFAFMSHHASNVELSCCRCFCLFQVDFDCGRWFVVPEVPLGTVLSLLTALVALPVFKLVRRKHPA